jgi:hypothetical protein
MTDELRETAAKQLKEGREYLGFPPESTDRSVFELVAAFMEAKHV